MATKSDPRSEQQIRRLVRKACMRFGVDASEITNMDLSTTTKVDYLNKNFLWSVTELSCLLVLALRFTVK